MSFDLFRNSLKNFLPYLIKVNLYDEGEPLLHNDIIKMIAYLKNNNIASCISTNFSLKLSDEYLKWLSNSGLDHIIIALDGASQDSYSKYRHGGNLTLVIDNLERLIKFNNEINSPLKTEIQFLEFNHNKHERDAVHELSKRLSVDRFTINKNCSIDGWEGDRFKGSEIERRKKGCYQLWVATTINSTGEIGTCDYGEDHGMENIGLASNYNSDRLRNHPSLVALRKSFNKKSIPLNAICKHCSLTM
jgi:MoaA/NifB/PqqE/SkfB family radical SAM enzyme